MTIIGEEQRPLLGPTHAPTHGDVEILADVPEGSRREAGAGKPTPLPMKQISILLLMGLCEPITFTVIYPFIAELVNKTGVTGGDSTKIGYYAGLIVKVVIAWPYPLLTSPYPAGIDILLYRKPLCASIWANFGSYWETPSSHVWTLWIGALNFLLWFEQDVQRTGIFKGIVRCLERVAKSMMVELTDETNQAQCFAFIPVMWSTGSTIGPFIGGTLSNPARLLPHVFDTPFWNEYPYLLPCLVTAMFTSFVFILSALLLQETHHPHVEPKPDPSSTLSQYGAVTEPTHAAPQPAPSVRSVLTKRACIAIINYAFLSFCDIAYLAVIPVMFAASTKSGGLGLTPRFIGLILGTQGIISGIVQVFCFAPLHRRLGSKRLLVIGLTAYTGLTLSFPVMNVLAQREMWWAVWTVMGVHILFSCPAVMTFGCMTIFVTSAAPSKSSLGTLNGISQTIISVIRAIGPATATSLFALSVDKQILGGWFVYAVLAGVNAGALVASRWLKEQNRAR
ncbi:hypothetical protein FRC12_009212 [Ceratobasidium sp. 428]|nr:hypothetical protein FRC12_009212 [Ceratobasidium sp. 428]